MRARFSFTTFLHFLSSDAIGFCSLPQGLEILRMLGAVEIEPFFFFTGFQLKKYSKTEVGWSTKRIFPPKMKAKWRQQKRESNEISLMPARRCASGVLAQTQNPGLARVHTCYS